jgi:hypothetical protein
MNRYAEKIRRMRATPLSLKAVNTATLLEMMKPREAVSRRDFSLIRLVGRYKDSLLTP